MSLLQYLGMPEGDMGLLGDPRAYAAAQGIAGLTNAFGGLAAAFAPTTDPGARARGFAAVGPLAQQGMAQVRQGAMQDYAGLKARQGMDRETAINDAISGRPDDQLSEAGRQYRGLLGQMPERVRAALPLLSPEQRGEVLGRVLSAQPARQNVVVTPGGALVNSETGQPVYQAPFAPQRAPLPGAYDHIRVMPNGEIVDLRQLGGGNAPQAPASPAMPGGAMPALTPPNVGLPAPGRASMLTPDQPAPDAAPAGGAPMLTPQPGDVTTAQGGPPAALPPGTLRAAPPPEWEQLTGPNARMRQLPDLPPGQFYERNSRTGQTRVVGGNGVNVNVGSGETVRGRADTETLKEVQTGANQARTVIALLDRAEQAVRSVPEGMGAQLVPVLGQTARALGFDISGTSEAEVLRGITTTLGTLQRVPGSGATTDFEMRLYMNAVPRLGTTREGNLELIRMGRALAERKIAEANIWRRHAGEPDLQDRLDALGPVFTQAQRQMLDVNPELSGYVDPVSRNFTPPPSAPAARPRARNAQGQVIEFNGQAWVPAQ